MRSPPPTPRLDVSAPSGVGEQATPRSIVWVEGKGHEETIDAPARASHRSRRLSGFLGSQPLNVDRATRSITVTLGRSRAIDLSRHSYVTVDAALMVPFRRVSAPREANGDFRFGPKLGGMLLRCSGR